jgi:hypothetical protein
MQGIEHQDASSPYAAACLPHNPPLCAGPHCVLEAQCLLYSPKRTFVAATGHVRLWPGRDERHCSKFHQSASEPAQKCAQLVVSQHFVVEPKPFYAAAPVDFWDSPHLHLKFIPGLFLDQIHDCVLFVRI